jgi:hypothetical protein
MNIIFASFQHMWCSKHFLSFITTSQMFSKNVERISRNTCERYDHGSYYDPCTGHPSEQMMQASAVACADCSRLARNAKEEWRIG